MKGGRSKLASRTAFRGRADECSFFSFLVDEGRKDPNTTVNDHRRPASRTAFRWRADDGPTLITGLVAL